ncbi:HopJ type III effector protein [Polaribacter batillariae]|uniref:HopJ type III effector protein n=1 Tax=Polaribacter batillariae TaxID=2808900 RepID=A0ABX7STG0_9FLAO|nr:HopJ type III effector protein [Polaribacter batillariae]QTD36831.1 HopJ type III effector protein [Polaribacter batillariae]
MNIQQFKTKLKSNPTAITFAETMQVIEEFYNFTPTAFTNGELKNKATENTGSCKLFAFAKLQKLTKEETLFCFGEHYKNVLEDKDGDGHQNIRNFIKTGFKGLFFERKALELK